MPVEKVEFKTKDRTVTLTGGKCQSCGDHGILDGAGHCADCKSMVTTRLVGPRILAEIKALLCAHIDDNADKINQAYIDEDKALTVSMSVKLGSDDNRPGVVFYSVGINFVADRVKVVNGGAMSETQRKLPGVG